MYIEDRLFSENTEEVLYSVLMDEEEYDLYSKLFSEVTWKRGTKINPSLINTVEKIYKIHFPVEFKDLVLNNNNGRPSLDTFDTIGSKGHVIKKLLSFDKKDLETVYKSKEVLEKEGISNVFPFAIDPFGNYICFNSKNSVVYWLHETGKIVPVANSFQEFIDSLY